MKTVVSRCRAALAIVLYLVFVLVVAAPGLAWLRLRLALAKTPPSERRTAFSRWKIATAAMAFRIVNPVLGVRARFDMLGPRTIGGYLVLANHRGSFDIPVIAEFLRRNGLFDARWVLKAQLKETLVIGTVCHESGCAFVSRAGTPDDLRAVERAGRWASEDGASMVIFPEGTTFDPAKRKPEFVNVLPPKNGGVSVLRTAMPEHRVLVLAIDWTDVGDAQDIWQAHEYVGKVLQVRARVLSHAEARHDEVRAWLEREWKMLDESL